MAALERMHAWLRWDRVVMGALGILAVGCMAYALWGLWHDQPPSTYPLRVSVSIGIGGLVLCCMGAADLILRDLGLRTGVNRMPWSSYPGGYASVCTGSWIVGSALLPLALRPSLRADRVVIAVDVGSLALLVFTFVVHGMRSPLALAREAVRSQRNLTVPTLFMCGLVAVILTSSIGWLALNWAALAPIYAYHGHSQDITSIEWSKDGRHIASADWLGSFRIWSPFGGGTIARLSCAHHQDAIGGSSFAWSPDGRRVASVCDTNTLASTSTPSIPVIQDIASGRTLFTLADTKAEISTLAWSPDGQYIASVDSTNSASQIRLWQASSGALVRQFPLPMDANNIAWSPNGHYLAVDGGPITIISADSGAIMETLRPIARGLSHNTIAWSPDSTRLAVAGDDNLTPLVEIWNISSGKRLLTYHGHQGGDGAFDVQCVAWSPDGRYIASGGDDETVQVWSATSGQRVFTWLGNLGSVHAVAWSPDGAYVASGGLDDVVDVWRPQLS